MDELDTPTHTLISIKPSPQVPCTPHKFLILVLLHLQLSLPLHADAPPNFFAMPLFSPLLQLPLPFQHPLEERLLGRRWETRLLG